MDKNSPESPRPPFSQWWWLAATWFGCGLSPVMSGTVGSLAALPFAYLIQHFGSNKALFLAAAVLFVVGTWASNLYLLHTGRDDDPSEIVVDEVAGQWLLLSALYPSWHSYLAGFLLFRAFDIVKPWPVSVADANIKGGFGVMFDDILAAIYPIGVFILIAITAYCFGEEKLLYRWLSFLT